MSNFSKPLVTIELEEYNQLLQLKNKEINKEENKLLSALFKLIDYEHSEMFSSQTLNKMNNVAKTNFKFVKQGSLFKIYE